MTLQPGEWVEYEFQLVTPSEVTISADCAEPSVALLVQVDEGTVAPSRNRPGRPSSCELTAGSHRVRVTAETDATTVRGIDIATKAADEPR